MYIKLSENIIKNILENNYSKNQIMQVYISLTMSLVYTWKTKIFFLRETIYFGTISPYIFPANLFLRYIKRYLY